MNTALQTQFHNIALSIINHNHKKWLTAEEVGFCLGYDKVNSSQCIRKLFNRHVDEFTEADSCRYNLYRQGQQREVLIFSESGCILLSMFANTPRAKEFRAWAKQVLSETAIPQATPATVEDRLSNVERSLDKMAGHMASLVAISHQQAQKLDVTARYIGLLEVNQKGKVKITRPIEAQVLALKAQGMPQADIARLLRISTSSVNLLVHGKYQFGGAEAHLPRESVEALLDRVIEAERAGLLEKLGGGK
ncbi:BRO family protein [Methylobacter sp.]|uniref:BRO family protein n=1 Tax=Methylobacter sp. TaxID=2051955 RepID=UPI002489BE56|nr:BRO family protein [Methylobacter sp.]MDI1278063.1 BRO family protein [Methylobacter sp.]